MTTRVDNWQAELHQVVLAYEHKPFAFGESDCACFAADWVQAITALLFVALVLGALGAIVSNTRPDRRGSVARIMDTTTGSMRRDLAVMAAISAILALVLISQNVPRGGQWTTEVKSLAAPKK